MPTPLLTTKLRLPQLPDDLVERPELAARLGSLLCSFMRIRNMGLTLIEVKRVTLLKMS